MTGQGMNDNELVQMLHETLPQDLTEQQIALLRAGMRASPVVREALLEEIRLETGLAARLVPEHMGAQEFIDKLERLAFDRGRTRWLWLSLIFVLVLGIVGGGIGIAWKLNSEKDPNNLAINNGNGTNTTDGGNKDDGTKTGVAVTPTIPNNTGPDKGTNNANNTAAPLIPPPLPALAPPWKLFDDATARGDYAWASRVKELVRPLGNSKLVLNDNEKDYALSGQFALYPPSEEGRVIRLRLTDPRRLRFTLWGESQGARIELDNDRVFRGFALSRVSAKAHPHGFPPTIDARFLRKNVIDRVDKNINFNWGSGSPGSGVDADNFAVRWTGTIHAPRAGNYRFFLTSNDGVILTIDGRTVVNDWADAGLSESYGEIDLTEGTHDLVVEYYESAGDAVMKMEWKGPGIDRQIVPQSALRTGRDDKAVPGLAAKYCWGPPNEHEPADTVALSTDDGGKWHILREGTFDLRYQKGHVLLCRADQTLLAIPMSEPPRELVMDTESRLWLAENLHLSPLADAAFAQEPKGETRKASELSWKLTPPDRKSIVTMTPGEDGSVEIAKNDEKNTLDFTYETPIDLPLGGEVTLEIARTTPQMVVQFHVPGENGGLRMGIGTYGNHRVLCWDPNNKGDVEQRYKQGYIVPERFFLRGEYGLGRLTVLISSDGKSWRRFETREYDPSRPPSREVTVSVYGLYDKGERRMKIASLSVRPRTALEALTDAALVKRVPEIKDDPTTRNYYFNDWHAQFAKAKPKEASEAAWRAACNLALAKSTQRCRVRQEAAIDLVRAAAGADAPTDALLAALAELPQQVSLAGEDSLAHSYAGLARLYDDLAQRFWNNGRRDDLSKLVDAWYAQDFGWEMRWYNAKHTAPPNLTRLLQFHLWDTKRWDELRLASMRYEFIAHQGHPWNNTGLDDYPLRLLGAWMLSRTREHLQDGPPIGEGSRQTDRVLPTRFPEHPLAIEADRESMNTVSEFLAAVDSKAFDHACRILTRQTLPDGIAPVDKENLLFKNTYVLLEQMIDANEPIASRLKEQYAPVGLIRLRQALDQGRFDVLESLATQFHGTQASRDALLHLADRDLSMGNFFSAASRYDALLEQADDAHKPHIIAKRRLALAMAGVDTQEPVKHRVQLGGQTLTGAEFEQLVTSLLAERKTADSIYADGKIVRVDAPGARELKLASLAELSPARDMHERVAARVRDVKFAAEGNTLVIHQHAKLTVMDLSTKQVRWQKSESARDLTNFISEPSTPLILGKRVYVSLFRERKIELTCFDLEKGDMVWRQAFDDALAGDPVAIGPWLYVISVQRQLGDYADVILRRISPATGESVLGQKVVRVRWGEELFRVGRPIAVGDTILFRTGASLVCCDQLGAPRWIRRLSLVPASIDSYLFDYQSLSAPIVHGDNVIVSCPGSPHVICINARTGEEVWSHLQPRLRKLVGPRGDKVILSTVTHLEALDAATGKVAWQTPITADYASILPAQKDTILALTLDRVEGKRTSFDRRVRKAEWISAADGRVVHAQDLPDMGEQIFDAENLFTNGYVILGVSNIRTKGKPGGTLFIMEGK